MRKTKGDFSSSSLFFFGWRRFLHLLLAAVFLCVISISVELPKLLKSQHVPISSNPSLISSQIPLNNEKPSMEALKNQVLNRKVSISEGLLRSRYTWKRSSEKNSSSSRDYGRIPKHIKNSKNGSPGILSGLERMANEAWVEGFQLWQELHPNSSKKVQKTRDGFLAQEDGVSKKEKQVRCPHSIFLSREDMEENGDKPLFQCGLMLGSSITVVGTPLPAHMEKLAKVYQTNGHPPFAMVSQFIVELQGLRVVDNEDPPRILHVNPRLKGDWSRKSIFEVNTCYRGQWGVAQRCNGLETKFETETVDGLRRCERWVLDEEKEKVSKEVVKPASLLDRLMGFSEKSNVYWSYPFAENQSFVMTIRAGWEGYHMSVDGRHIASSPYRTGFSLEDATGLAVKGDIELHSVLATSLPTSRPTHEAALELQEKLKMPEPRAPFDFFIGILSAANHFAERMAIRKTWMQSKLIKSSKVVARFFIALHTSMDVNIQLKKEAEYYGDVVIVPFLDRYELLVLKTIAICEYAIRNTSAKYIMKCDDDNFVRVETVVDAVKATGHEHGLYMGNINLGHKPLRTGKWAVTFEDWPEEGYPPYANGPGYIVTRDIADFIASEHANNTLRIFKMEDVSMGMWVVQYNLWHQVHYQHTFKFCQFGCINEYYTAHYQSPHHMLCMWEKLLQGKAECCT